MKILHFNPKKNKAQAIVEFAIALPILLMLVYGLLEVGRLVFTYASVVNASRQAARWGSTTGMGDGGVIGAVGTYPRYQDCAGIRGSAQRGDFLHVFDNSDIHIYYDAGPGYSRQEYCWNKTYDTTLNDTTLSDNKHRIVVSINGHFNALIPKLVPFITRIINATSARTIVASVSLTGSGSSSNKEITTLTITDTPDASYVNQSVTVTVTANGASTTPTGTVDITGADTDCTITLTNGTGSCVVVFSSIGDKTIKAHYSGDETHLEKEQTEAHSVELAPTTTTIMADTPDPSSTNEAVNVVVSVTSPWQIPTGTVSITGANTNCIVTLVNGLGNCSVIFTSNGTKTITATYNGSDVHKVSSNYPPGESHTVAAPTPGPSATPSRTPTATTAPTNTATATPTLLCSVNYSFQSTWNDGFTANVSITNNGSTPINGWSLAWSFADAGQRVTNMWGATYTQNGLNITATNVDYTQVISPGNSQSFGFNGAHNGNNPKPTSFTVNGVPCHGAPTPTPTRTVTSTPTIIPTPVSCGINLTHQRNPNITIADTTMSMKITNNTGVPLTIKDVTVSWNNALGRAGGAKGKPLDLVSVYLSGVVLWSSGPANAASYTITPSSTMSIPTGTSTITFTFAFVYSNINNSERIYINFSTPGCDPLDSGLYPGN